MANKQRGEVEVRSASGTVYTLRLGSGALCQLEETLNLNTDEIFDQWKGRFRARWLREFVKVLAVDPPAPSDEAATALIDEVGILAAVGAVSECIALAFDEGTTGSNGNGAAVRPPVPPVGKRARRATGAGISTAAPS